MTHYMPEWTQHVGYFDPVEWSDALVCGDCGAVVHPAASESHGEFHARLNMHVDDDSRHRQ